ncbi:MbnP family protein [Corallibacter sp.]|uniref:MbnP family protein n=1 Tax=Corallibacter sp. TaxID=2038084 RepID=UPI003AB5AA71
MKKLFLIMTVCALFFNCSSDNNVPLNVFESNVNPTFNFTHTWDETSVTNDDFNTISFTNANGDMMSIERLRYLISNITFHHEDGTQYVIPDYLLVDLNSGENLTFESNFDIPKGNYTNVTFTFGFNNDDNYNTSYPDLNSASWNVPDMLGGGYHYMQLEGKFIDNTDTEIGYQYHAIRAVNATDPDNLVFQDTFFEVNLGETSITNDITFDISMNIAAWFKNPNLWDLNNLHSMMMPDFDAQVMIYNNGQDVFSLSGINQ